MEVISTRKYDATSSSKALPAAKPTSTTTTTTAPNIVTHYTDMFIQNPENSTAKVIEEEWETRKKKEITTTRQIETRIKRQVVLEDGEVIKDSGPFVTTNTTEDIEQQEQTTQEKRTIANDDNSLKRRREGSISPSISANFNRNITVTSDKITSDGGGGSIIQKELNETIVKSREEVEELVETEKRQHLGDITDEAYQLAIIRNNNNSRKNLRMTLAETVNQLSSDHIEPRVIQHTTKSNKVVDTEKKIKRTGLKPDGAIVTETKTSVTHEEINDVPDYSYSDNNGNNDDNNEMPREIKKESSQKFYKQRDEDVVDYLLNGEKIARERRFISEITEGDKVGDFDDNIRTTLNRKNVLTKKTLSLDEEDEVKKFETSKWLENHFGSDHGLSSHSSKDEIVTNTHNDNNRQVQVQTMNNKSFINVTMKSSKSQDRKNNNKHKDTYINTYIDQSYSEHDQPVRLSNKQIKSERISNWSERQQQHNTTDKPNVNGNSPSSLLSLSSSSTTTSSYCIIETPHTNGGDKEQIIEQQENLPPQQTMSKKIFEDSSCIRTSSVNSAPRYYTETTKKHKQLQRNTSNSSSSLIQQRCHCQNNNKNNQQISVTNKCKCETDDLNLSSPLPQLPPHSSSVQVIQRTRDNRNKKVYHHPPPQQQKQYHYHGQFDNLQTSESMNNSPQQRFCCHRRRNRDRRCRSSSPPSLITFSSTPTLIKREKKSSKSNALKNSSNNTSTSSKSKIGESFRRFVNKLRSASTERRNKKSSVNGGGDSGGNSGNSNLSNTTSVSQVTQTDNTKNPMATYLQYNVIDKNIPDTQYHYNQTNDDIHEASINSNSDGKSLQEKSSKNGSSVISSSAPGITKTIKVTRLNGHIANYDQYGRNNSITPVHRYYIKESFIGGRQNSDRDAGYKNKSATKSRKPIAPLPPSSTINNDDNNNNNNNSNMNNDDEISDRYICKNNNNNIKYNQTLSRSNHEPSTFLGRFSKSASRLMTSPATINEYDQKDRQVTSTQTLPRKLQRYLLVRNNNNNNNNSSLTKKKPMKPPIGTSTNQFSSSHNHLNYIKSSSSSSPSPTQSFAPLSSMSPSSNKSMHYGSMINISIKHNAPPPTVRDNTPPKMAVVNNTGTLPVKPGRSYKSSLSRSKSFNVLEDNTVAYNNNSSNARNYSPRITYKSNTQLHRLDETPTPLKSPSILASINRYGGSGENTNSNKNL